jgi:hypothetical protein
VYKLHIIFGFSCFGPLLSYGIAASRYDGAQRVNSFHAYSFAEKRWSPVSVLIMFHAVDDALFLFKVQFLIFFILDEFSFLSGIHRFTRRQTLVHRQLPVTDMHPLRTGTPFTCTEALTEPVAMAVFFVSTFRRWSGVK